MPLSVQHRHALLLADRTGDIGTITTVVTEVLAANPETTPLEIETALRDAGALSYLIAGATLSIVRGMPAMLLTLAPTCVSVEQNRAAWRVSLPPESGYISMHPACRSELSVNPPQSTPMVAIFAFPAASARRFYENPDQFADAFARAWFKLTHRDMGPILCATSARSCRRKR